MDKTIQRCREALAMLAQDGDMCHWTDAHTLALKDAVAVFSAERTDAERYRWLRDKAARASWDKPVVCEGSRDLGDNETFLEGDALDLAVDAAMATAPVVGAA